jgi:hypothetical protein
LDAPEVVVDAFHVVRLGNVMVDDVRRRVHWPVPTAGDMTEKP